jgi:hypothetical protein
MTFNEWWSGQAHRPPDSRGAAGDAWDKAASIAAGTLCWMCSKGYMPRFTGAPSSGRYIHSWNGRDDNCLATQIWMALEGERDNG